MPTRIDAELFESAKATGAAQSRSAAQQVSHWARIGRELESSTNVSHKSVSRVLAGLDPYDEIGEREQAIVRAKWDEAITARLASIDLAAEFEAAGDSWTDADAAGTVITHSPST